MYQICRKVEPGDMGLITRISKIHGIRAGYLMIKISYAPLAIKRGIHEFKKKYVVLSDSLYIYKNESACKSEAGTPEDIISLDSFFVSKVTADLGLEDISLTKIFEFNVHTEVCVVTCQSNSNDDSQNWLNVFENMSVFF
jgi:hypothetical protein